MPCCPYLHPAQCQLHPRALERAGISSSRCRACSGRALSARFARARTTPTRRTAALVASHLWPLLACRTTPGTRPLSSTLQPLPGTLQRRLGSTPASAADSAADGAAQTTSARQLPQSTGRAYPPARRHAFVASTMPCNYRKVVAGDLIFCRHRASLATLYKGTPSPSEHSRDIRPSP